MPDKGLLERKLSRLPDSPGVYIMKDSRGRILYIGKAISLKNRVRSYFRKNPDSVKTLFLSQKIRDVEYYSVSNENEALILEANLVQKEKPPYNIRLKDDKNYPYLAITRETYPRLAVVRHKDDRHLYYFGPYTSSRAMRQALDFINKNFKLRKCEGKLAFGKTAGKPCLYFQMGQCLAPCQGKVPEEDYSQVMQEVVLFLNAEYEKLIPRLEEKMKERSLAMNFEAAALLRDTIKDIRSVIQKQSVNLAGGEDLDLVCHAEKDGTYSLLVVFIRAGKISGRKVYFHEDPLGLPREEVVEAFVKQFYTASGHVPAEIVASIGLPDAAGVGRWLSDRFSRTVKIRKPGTDPEKKIVSLMTSNAVLQLEEHLIEEMSRNRKRNLFELKKSLRLKKLPVRIEAFDISNLGSRNPVASMVTFSKGMPDKSGYRHYKIRYTPGQNDFAMIEEAVGRRYQRLLNENKPLPDLILIDGGPAQLKSAYESVRKLGLKDIHLVSLAKKEEQIYTLHTEKPLSLPRDSAALQLLQRVRDEAHRFAVTFHKKLRSKEFLPKK